MTKTIYLASPIDQGTATTLLETIKTNLHQLGYVTYDPTKAWHTPPEATPNPTIQTANLAVLEQTNLLLAILKPQTLTIGVTIELIHAHQNNIPTVVLAPGLKPSWALAYLELHPHQTIEETMQDIATRRF